MSFTRLLLVDDDAELCALLKARLEKTGKYSVDHVNESTKAHSRAKYLGPDNIDLFVLDIDMPDISGGELAELLQEDPAFADTPIMFLTSLVRPDEVGHNARKLRFPVVSKGGSLRDLVEAIDKIVGSD